MSPTPEAVVRFFDKREYAESFIAGEVRFGSLSYYRSIDNNVGDTTEGKVELSKLAKDGTTLRYSSESLNEYYILSTSLETADRAKLSDRFQKRVIVRIGNTASFLDRLRAVWRGDPRALGRACFVGVTYNKGCWIDLGPASLAPLDYSYAQKPPSHSAEMEWRYVLPCSFPNGGVRADHLTLTLPDCSDICTLS